MPLHCKILENNINVYGLKNVKMYCYDYYQIMRKLKQDVIFFDPPWGGRSYVNECAMSLGINNVNIVSIINLLIDSASCIVLRVPHNYNYTTFFQNLCRQCRAKVYYLENNYYKSQALIVVKKAGLSKKNE